MLIFSICFRASNYFPGDKNYFNYLHFSGSKIGSFTILVKNLSIIFIRLETNSSSLLNNTLDFINANKPFSGNAGNIYPPSFLERILIKSQVLSKSAQIPKNDVRLCNNEHLSFWFTNDSIDFPQCSCLSHFSLVLS